MQQQDAPVLQMQITSSVHLWANHLCACCFHVYACILRNSLSSG